METTRRKGDGNLSPTPIVVPAEAGIHFLSKKVSVTFFEMGPGFRWDDGVCASSDGHLFAQ